MFMIAAGTFLILGSGAVIASYSFKGNNTASAGGIPPGSSTTSSGNKMTPLKSVDSASGNETSGGEPNKGPQMTEVTPGQAEDGSKELVLEFDPSDATGNANAKLKVVPSTGDAGNGNDSSAQNSGTQSHSNSKKPGPPKPPKPSKLNNVASSSGAAVLPSDLIQKIKDANTQSFKLPSSMLSLKSNKMMYKKIENASGQPLVVFSKNPATDDNLFGSKPSGSFNSKSLESAEVFEFYEKIDGHNYRYTVTFLKKPVLTNNVSWIYQNGQEAELQKHGGNFRTILNKFFIFNGSNLLENTDNLSKYQMIIKVFNEYLKDGARFIVTREPVPDDKMVLKTVSSATEISPWPVPALETMIHKIDNVFNQTGSTGYYYHIGGEHLQLPDSDAFASHEKWTAPEKDYHVYHKLLDEGFEIYIKSPKELEPAKIDLIGTSIAESIQKVERKELNASLATSWKEFLNSDIDNASPLTWWYSADAESPEVCILMVKKSTEIKQ